MQVRLSHIELSRSLTESMRQVHVRSIYLPACAFSSLCTVRIHQQDKRQIPLKQPQPPDTCALRMTSYLAPEVSRASFTTNSSCAVHQDTLVFKKLQVFIYVAGKIAELPDIWSQTALEVSLQLQQMATQLVTSPVTGKVCASN